MLTDTHLIPTDEDWLEYQNISDADSEAENVLEEGVELNIEQFQPPAKLKYTERKRDFIESDTCAHTLWHKGSSVPIWISCSLSLPSTLHAHQ